MKNKTILIISIMIIILISLSIIIKNIDNKEYTKNLRKENSSILFNQETGMYYIVDENGKILHEAEDKSSLYIYTIDSNYNPKTPEMVQ